MTDQLIDGRVIPYPHGRRENDSRLWRDATDLELEQAARIEELEQQLEAEKQNTTAFNGILVAVEEAIKNGDCPMAIEIAFDKL